MVQPVVTFHRPISLGSYRRMKSEVVREEVDFWKKNDPLRDDFENFVPQQFINSQIHVLYAYFVKFGRPEVSEIARCLPDKTNKKSTSAHALASARITPKICQGHLSGPAPDSILEVPQISSKSVHFRRSYSRTRERRSNAPQSVCNTRRSFSFFAE